MNSEDLVLIQETRVPEQPRYLKDRNIANNYTVVLSTIIVICAIVALITSIKRKSKKRIILSVILPIFAIIISRLLPLLLINNYNANGLEVNNGIYIFLVLGLLIAIAITLIIMIFNKTKREE